jgi:hypothetical protein
MPLLSSSALGRKLPHKFTVSGKTIIVWGLHKFVDDYFNGATVEIPDGVIKTQSVAGHSRKMFPSDPGFNVAGHSRRVMKGGTVSGTTAVPGEPFTFEKGLLVAERWTFSNRHTFSIQGTITDFRTVFEEKRKGDVKVILPSSEIAFFLGT